MAKYTFELPTEIMQDIRRINDNADEIFGKMTKAAADAVAGNVRSNAPLPELAKSVRVTRTYKTPSDDGINNKVYFSGYDGKGTFTRRGRAGSDKYTSTKGMPYDFLARVYEYGTSQRFTDQGAYRGSIHKRPFFRKAFKSGEIERIMLETQKSASGGLLDES